MVLLPTLSLRESVSYGLGTKSVWTRAFPQNCPWFDPSSSTFRLSLVLEPSEALVTPPKPTWDNTSKYDYTAPLVCVRECVCVSVCVCVLTGGALATVEALQRVAGLLRALFHSRTALCFSFMIFVCLIPLQSIVIHIIGMLLRSTSTSTAIPTKPCLLL